MAFEGEYGDFHTEKKPTDGPITTWDTNPLFTFFVQLVSGLILLVEWGIALAFIPYILQFAPVTGPINPVGLVVMVLFVPVGLVQVFLGYRLYKRTPNTINLSFMSALLVIVMSAILIISGYMTDSMSDPSLPVIQIGANIVLAYLSSLSDVKDHFEGGRTRQSM